MLRPVLLSLLLAAVALPAGSATGQVRRCLCIFSDSTFEGYGTKAACSTYMRKNATSCEVAFAGMGCDRQKLIDVLGMTSQEADAYTSTALVFSIRYLQHLNGREQLQSPTPALVAEALLYLPRAVYMREQVDTDEAQFLDRMFQNIAKELAGAVFEVIAGRTEEFTRQFDGYEVSVTRSSLRATTSVGTVTVIFGPPPEPAL